MRIVLVRPNYDSHIITPPLGLGYLSSSLKKHGIETVIIDGLREKLDNAALLARILKIQPDAVGITCLTSFYEETINLARLVKSNNLKCIIGGVHPTFLAYQTLADSGADFIICGEGEIAFPKLVKNNFINNGILGVYSKDNLRDENMPIVKAEIIQNLDDLPFPAWDLVNMKDYRGWFLHKRSPEATYLTKWGTLY